MALANLQNDLFSSNPAGTSAASGQKPNLVEAHAAIWAAVGKIAEKEARRDDLSDGSAHDVELMITAKVNGQIYRQGFKAGLSVGHSSQRASSVNPNIGQVLALVLGKLNAATREKILRELPDDFAANGGELPATDAAIKEAADGMLKKMRASKPQVVRGSVSCKIATAQPPLSIVG